MRISVLFDLILRKRRSLTGSRSRTTDLAWVVMPLTCVDISMRYIYINTHPCRCVDISISMLHYLFIYILTMPVILTVVVLSSVVLVTRPAPATTSVSI